MKNSDYKLNHKVVSLLVIGHIVFMLLGIFAQIYEMDSAHFFLSAAITFFFSSWLIILSDLVKQKVFNKSFWILAMFITPSIAMVSYIFMRNRVIRLGEKINKAQNLI
ncbi:MAG: hypothetical protein PF448_00825 [Bacteroidales bacterium]|jgi:hypothetical membrane protein|nr:hypothetical protein [Bacteroidales bacterium]